MADTETIIKKGLCRWILELVSVLYYKNREDIGRANWGLGRLQCFFGVGGVGAHNRNLWCSFLPWKPCPKPVCTRWVSEPARTEWGLARQPGTGSGIGGIFPCPGRHVCPHLQALGAGTSCPPLPAVENPPIISSSCRREAREPARGCIFHRSRRTMWGGGL